MVALDHELQEGPVDDVHLLLVFAIKSALLLAADDDALVLQVGGNGPVEGQVGEGRLPAPAGGHVEAVDELLDVLLDAIVVELVVADERRQQGVDAGEGLGPGEFALHGADIIDHVQGGRLEVLGRRGMDLVGNVAEAAPEEIFQGPAGAISDDGIGQVVEVEVAVLVGLLDGLGIDVVEGVVGEDLAGDPGIQPGKAHRAFIGVFPDLPVVVGDVVLDEALQVDAGLLGLADALVAFAVEDVGLGHFQVTALHQHHFDHVLDLLDRGRRVSAELFLDDEGDDIGDGLGLGEIVDALRFHGLVDGVGDLVLGEVDNRAVALLDSGDHL